MSMQMAICRLMVVVACFAVAGCDGGAKHVTVQGKILDGGQPLSLDSEAYTYGGAAVEVRFHPVEVEGEDAQSYSATAAPDGTFVMDGGTGEGIPVGTYKVVLTNRNPMADRAARGGGGGDVWGGKFSIENTPFEVDVQEENQMVELDIATATPAS